MIQRFEGFGIMLVQKFLNGSPAIQLRSIDTPLDFIKLLKALLAATAAFLVKVNPPAAYVNLH